MRTYLPREVHIIESVHDVRELVHGLCDSDGDRPSDAPRDNGNCDQRQCHNSAGHGNHVGDFRFQF